MVSRREIPPPEAGARLTIDLGALVANWRDLAALAAPGDCAGVVKADAYGLGIAEAVPALAEAGCATFFVALPVEARQVRAAAPEATIYVLGGFAPESAAAFDEAGARPVLGSLAEVEAWAALCHAEGARRPAAIHVDTGMNRLGLSADEVDALAARPELTESFELALVMSHLACADTPEHPLNARQVDRFTSLRARFPPTPASLANSGGTLLGPPYRLDLARPGIAVYGGRALADRPNPMRPVVRLEARILQVRTARAGERVGYGAVQTLTRDTRLAILAAGYADGYIRAAGGADGRPGASAYLGGHRAPLVGRVSMDLIAIDVTDVPEIFVKSGNYAELLGDNFTVDDLADRAGTIGYEVLTRLGGRVHRVYSGE